MNVINRIILFFYALAFGAVSLLTIGLFARIFSDARIWNEFLYLCSRWETLAVAIVVFLLSLYLIIQSLSTTNKNVSASEAMIVKGKLGEVQVSLSALKDMADRIARSAYGVRDVKVRLKMTKASGKDRALVPNFTLKLVVSEDKNIITIGDDIKYQLNSYLHDFIGIENANIQISVSSISNGADKSKKRVV